MNNFTADDIKKSVDYQWRMWVAKSTLNIWLSLSAVLFVILFVISARNQDKVMVNLTQFIVFFVAYGLPSVVVALYSFCKAKKLLRNYHYYSQHEVELTSPQNSHLYRGAIYFVVKIKVSTCSLWVRTNPCFSSLLLSKFKLYAYNNQKVVGLYDKVTDKFYVIKRVN